MKIGIDIDDTIVNTWEACIPYFAKLFDKTETELRKLRPYYRAVSDKCSLKEYYKMVGNTYEQATKGIKANEEAVKVINKLYDMGYEIIFVTARKMGFKDSYKHTEEFLRDNNIKYDKLIVDARNKKGDICKKEKIDIMIDDGFHNCIDAISNGIDAIMIGTKYNEEKGNVTRLNSWKEIYDYIVSR